MAAACGRGDSVAVMSLGRCLLALGLGIGLGAAACGPIGYANEVARHASTAVEDARTVDAAKHSPYWWTRAVEYLHKARELAARAEFQAANRYGTLAAEAAETAAEETRRADRGPQ